MPDLAQVPLHAQQHARRGVRHVSAVLAAQQRDRPAGTPRVARAQAHHQVGNGAGADAGSSSSDDVIDAEFTESK
jgi:hypothetical protein